MQKSDVARARAYGYGGGARIHRNNEEDAQLVHDRHGLSAFPLRGEAG